MENEILSNIAESLQYTNALLAGLIFFLGCIFGLLLMKVFYERFIK